MSNVFIILIAAFIAFVVGFFFAIVFSATSNRKRQADALLLRENELKAFYIQEQHQLFRPNQLLLQNYTKGTEVH